jgi:hypothetical protein
MYTHNRATTAHKIDPSASLVDGTSITTGACYSSLPTYVNSANFGSQQHGYVTYRFYNNSSDLMLNAQEHFGFGVMLQPISSAFRDNTNQPFFCELTIAFANATQDSKAFAVSGFMGYSESLDSISPGWVNCDNWHLIPTLRSDSNGVYCKECVLIQNIVSGSFDHDKGFICGLRISNPFGIDRNLKQLNVTISARYARQKIVTQDLTR